MNAGWAALARLIAELRRRLAERLLGRRRRTTASAKPRPAPAAAARPSFDAICVWKTAPSAATPVAMPTWRKVLLIPEAIPARAGVDDADRRRGDARVGQADPEPGEEEPGEQRGPARRRPRRRA